MKVLVPVGTRPEIIKLWPVIRRLRDDGFDTRVVATGQHFDSSLTDVFYRRFDFEPDEQWELRGDEAERVSGILRHGLDEIAEHRPDLLLVLGDTWTVPLLSVAARRHRVPVAHLEAGMRSFNPTSLEEVNRRVAAAVAQVHLAPTQLAADFLRAEGVDDERIFVVGNPVIDTLRELGVRRVPAEDRAGVVLTAHRPTNVDDRSRLTKIVELVEWLMGAHPPVVFPIHPRTSCRLEEFGLRERLAASGADLVDPLPYDEMLELLARSLVAVTDSGGIQEEAAWLGVPVVVLRRSTPRWEGVAAGTSVLCGLEVDRCMAAIGRFCTPDEQQKAQITPCSYGDGHTAERVACVLSSPETRPLLALEEPDFVGRPLPWQG